MSTSSSLSREWINSAACSKLATPPRNPSRSDQASVASSFASSAARSGLSFVVTRTPNPASTIVPEGKPASDRDVDNPRILLDDVRSFHQRPHRHASGRHPL